MRSMHNDKIQMSGWHVHLASWSLLMRMPWNDVMKEELSPWNCKIATWTRIIVMHFPCNVSMFAVRA
eukprot:scaffold122034_cov32-Tisochrysis_lutea.AAC.1